MCIIGATYSECVRMAGPGPNYALTANVDAKSLSGLGAAGYRLCLVKGGVQGSSGGVQLPIVWVSSVAFESNRMEWDQNSYDIYASTQGIQQGVILTAQSSTSGVDQSKLYTFSNGVFTASSDLATPGYVMQNDMSQYYTFGLQQSTMFNGTLTGGVVSGIEVPAGGTAQFQPMEAVTIFFYLHAQSGQIISDSATEPCTIYYTPQNPSVTVQWDPTNSRFVPVPQAEKGACTPRVTDKWPENMYPHREVETMTVSIPCTSGYLC